MFAQYSSAQPDKNPDVPRLTIGRRSGVTRRGTTLWLDGVCGAVESGSVLISLQGSKAYSVIAEAFLEPEEVRGKLAPLLMLV